MKIILLISCLITLIYTLAPLEQFDGSGIHFGAWYDRLNGDTPVKINQRLGSKPMSFFQSDMNITETMDEIQLEYIDEFVRQVEETNSDAFIYLTLYPFFGFERVTDTAIDQFAQRVKKIVDSGRKILIRYASEMNGSWFAYGQKPILFKLSWKKMVSYVREVTKDHPDSVAFLWAPNSGVGYPFPNNIYSAKIGSSGFDPELDTNNDGKYDDNDDPFTPYYPGDEYVDWVGFSLYHYGNHWLHTKAEGGNGWHTNDIPPPLKAENYISGRDDPLIDDEKGFRNKFNFYDMFSGSGTKISKGGKPFFITETAAAIHLSFSSPDGFVKPSGSDENSRVKIRQAWYLQMLNSTFLAKYPKIKGLSFFEFIKYEEFSCRDFTILGKGTEINSIFGGDGSALDGASLTTFKGDLNNGIDKMIRWANGSKGKSRSSALHYLSVMFLLLLLVF